VGGFLTGYGNRLAPSGIPWDGKCSIIGKDGGTAQMKANDNRELLFSRDRIYCPYLVKSICHID
jgi:hypothetical protein